MALVEEALFGRVDKVQIAIDRLKSFAPRNGEPYWLAFSGGKDSQCIYELAKMAVDDGRLTWLRNTNNYLAA